MLVIAPMRTDITDLITAFASTSGGRAELVACVTFNEGPPGDDGAREGTDVESFTYGTALVRPGPLGTVVNRLANGLARRSPDHSYRYIGILGENTMPVVNDWDTMICDELDALGHIGLVHPEWACADECSTPAFITAETVRLLNYLVPIPVRRFFLTDAVIMLADDVERSSCVPGLFAHRHPATFQPGSVQQYAADCRAFERWKNNEYDRDLLKLGVRCGTHRRVRLETRKINP